MPWCFTFSFIPSIIEPCPSPKFQSLLGDILRSEPEAATRFIDTLLNQLNWSFSEFIGMMQEVRFFHQSLLLKVKMTDVVFPSIQIHYYCKFFTSLQFTFIKTIYVLCECKSVGFNLEFVMLALILKKLLQTLTGCEKSSHPMCGILTTCLSENMILHFFKDIHNTNILIFR
jgi:hypothetical protein